MSCRTKQLGTQPSLGRAIVENSGVMKGFDDDDDDENLWRAATVYSTIPSILFHRSLVNFLIL